MAGMIQRSSNKATNKLERTENYRRWIKTKGNVLREISGGVHRYIAKK